MPEHPEQPVPPPPHGGGEVPMPEGVSSTGSSTGSPAQKKRGSTPPPPPSSTKASGQPPSGPRQGRSIRKRAPLRAQQAGTPGAESGAHDQHQRASSQAESAELGAPRLVAEDGRDRLERLVSRAQGRQGRTPTPRGRVRQDRDTSPSGTPQTGSGSTKSGASKPASTARPGLSRSRSAQPGVPRPGAHAQAGVPAPPASTERTPRAAVPPKPAPIPQDRPRMVPSIAPHSSSAAIVPEPPQRRSTQERVPVDRGRVQEPPPREARVERPRRRPQNRLLAALDAKLEAEQQDAQRASSTPSGSSRIKRSRPPLAARDDVPIIPIEPPGESELPDLTVPPAPMVPLQRPDDPVSPGGRVEYDPIRARRKEVGGDPLSASYERLLKAAQRQAALQASLEATLSGDPASAQTHDRPQAHEGVEPPVGLEAVDAIASGVPAVPGLGNDADQAEPSDTGLADAGLADAGLADTGLADDTVDADQPVQADGSMLPDPSPPAIAFGLPIVRDLGGTLALGAPSLLAEGIHDEPIIPIARQEVLPAIASTQLPLPDGGQVGDDTVIPLVPRPPVGEPSPTPLPDLPVQSLGAGTLIAHQVLAERRAMDAQEGVADPTALGMAAPGVMQHSIHDDERADAVLASEIGSIHDPGDIIDVDPEVVAVDAGALDAPVDDDLVDEALGTTVARQVPDAPEAEPEEVPEVSEAPTSNRGFRVLTRVLIFAIFALVCIAAYRLMLKTGDGPVVPTPTPIVPTTTPGDAPSASKSASATPRPTQVPSLPALPPRAPLPSDAAAPPALPGQSGKPEVSRGAGSISIGARMVQLTRVNDANLTSLINQPVAGEDVQIQSVLAEGKHVWLGTDQDHRILAIVPEPFHEALRDVQSGDRVDFVGTLAEAVEPEILAPEQGRDRLIRQGAAVQIRDLTVRP